VRVSICTSILSKNHHLNTQTKLKEGQNLAFQELLPKEVIVPLVKGDNHRERIYTPEITLWAFLSQAIEEDKSQQAAVSRIVATSIANGEPAPSANTSAFSQARSNLDEESISLLAKNTAQEVVAHLPKEWLWKQKRIKIVDGSTVSMPDTPSNQEAYPQSKCQKAGVGFPIARMVVLIDYATGVLLDLAQGPCKGKETGEHALLRQLLTTLTANDLLLGDRYYSSYFLMATLIMLGVSGVFPLHHTRHPDFRTGTILGKKDHIVSWKKPAKTPNWMTREEYDAFPSEISVREVAVEIKQQGFRAKTLILVSTLLDAREVSKTALASLYSCRWFIELSLRALKETMGMDILRGKTPSMIRKELWVHLLAYNLIRRWMAQAAWCSGKAVATLSFKLTLQLLRAFDSFALLVTPEQRDQIALSIASKTVANRPGREEPRRVKRRPKPFPLLQMARGLYKNGA
jgi:hypothetical protein